MQSKTTLGSEQVKEVTETQHQPLDTHLLCNHTACFRSFVSRELESVFSAAAYGQSKGAFMVPQLLAELQGGPLFLRPSYRPYYITTGLSVHRAAYISCCVLCCHVKT